MHAHIFQCFSFLTQGKHFPCKAEDEDSFHILKWYYKHAGKILSGMPLYLVIFLLWLLTVRKLKIREIGMYGWTGDVTQGTLTYFLSK